MRSSQHVRADRGPGSPATVTVAVAALAAATLTGCHSSDSDRIKPKSEVDLLVVRNELIAKHGVQTGINMDKWYDLTVKDCERTPDEWDMFIAIGQDQGTDNHVISRTSMEYVCPGRAHEVDDSLLRGQERNAKFTQACRIPASMRTIEQQELAAGVGCK